MKRIAVFASGSGSNAENLVRYFHISHQEKEVCVSLIAANRPDAYVLERAQRLSVPTLIFSRTDFYSSSECKTHPIINKLFAYRIDYIILAGFLWLVPEYLIDAYPGRILNLHPALLDRKSTRLNSSHVD
jgi:phosphoribosylglycinamide formyltransferase-1